MPDFDLLIHGADNVPFVGIADRKFAAFSEGTAKTTIDATGCTLLPGVIDAHVHFNEPGRTEWEGIATGSRAAAAGGITTFFDMPLNSYPPVCYPKAFDLKLAAMREKSIVDFGLWGGLVPGNVAQMEPLAERGVIGFKAFLSNSGIEDFHHVPFADLKLGMKEAARLNLPVGVHAESDTITSRLTQAARSRGARGIRDYLDTRPVAAELAAIDAALDLAGETGCALQVVHVSSAEGIHRITAAKAAGVNVTAETCPHYLVLTSEDMERLGAVAKCAPPLRDPSVRDELLELVREGQVDTIGSDHSPAPWSMKTSDDFFKVWGGIAGVQHLLLLLADLDLSTEQLAAVTAGNVARRFRVDYRKGSLSAGLDADITLIRRTAPEIITPGDLLYRHAISPYVGRKLKHRIEKVILRGMLVSPAQENTQPGGELIRPAR